MLRRFHWLPLLLVLVGAVTALVTLARRHAVESSSRSVGLVLDHAQLRTLTSATGVPLSAALERFKEAGVTGVAITEESLGSLQGEGVLQVDVARTLAGRQYRVTIPDPEVATRVAEYVPRFVRGATEKAPPPGDHVVLPGAGGGGIYIPGRFDDIRGAPTGLDEDAVREVRDAGLEPVARIGNTLGHTAESIRWDLASVKALGATTLIFSGEEVLGARALIPQTADAFRELGLYYGSVEFGKQRGDETLSQKLEERLLRVHSIPAAEMPRLTTEDAIERYVRAAAERNIRLNYVRLPGAVTGQTFEDSVDYVADISSRLRSEGFQVGSATPIGRVWDSSMMLRGVRALIALGIGAGAVLLLASLVPLSRGLQAGGALAAGLVAAALSASGISIGLTLVALLGAIVFPSLAFVLLPLPVGAFDSHEHPSRARGDAVRWLALGEFAVMSVVTLVGAVMVAALLSELSYLVKVKSFAGIKAATVIPLLLVGWVYLTGMSGYYPSWQDEREAVVRRLRGFFSEPIRVWHAVAVVVGLVALVLVVARSGNDSGVGVSELEIRFRSLLDRVVGVRPRTKEFMLGHPALLLGLAMSVRPQWRLWAFPLLLVGIIGQVGMLNSFCHLHTPIVVTLQRTWNGLWTGALMGMAVVFGWQTLVKRTQTSTGGTHP